MVTTVYLIRHCEAQGNTNGTFQGHTDCDVSGNGRVQLDLLSIRCRNLPLDAIYSSPLKRAYCTAEAVGRYHKLKIQTDPRLEEINGGDCEGTKWDDFSKNFPQQNQEWYQAPWKFAAPHGETMQQVYDRTWQAMEDIVDKNQGKTIAVVSHGFAIRNLLCHAMGKKLEQINEVDWCDNTAVSILKFTSPKALPKIVLLNDASHLTPEVSVFAHQGWWKKENQMEEPS
jgi:probable phosphoglycerate mutase